ncbi:MAG: hypothetical protein ACK4ON_06120, partial [Bacteroidia bacterium]
SERETKKEVAYLSAEFLIGPQLANNLLNLGIREEAKEAVENYGYNLEEEGKSFIQNKNYRLDLQWLIKCYESVPDKNTFFNNFFNNLSGNDVLKKQIIDGVSEGEIRKSWQKDLMEFKKIRKKYLLYEDFE